MASLFILLHSSRMAVLSAQPDWSGGIDRRNDPMNPYRQKAP